MAMAAGEPPALPIHELLKARMIPVFETLKMSSSPGWPEVWWSWFPDNGQYAWAKVKIRNGATYLRKFRLRLDGPDIDSGRVLPLWTNQYFDLLPNETAECSVELRTAAGDERVRLALVGEKLQRSESKNYPIPER